MLTGHGIEKCNNHLGDGWADVAGDVVLRKKFVLFLGARAGVAEKFSEDLGVGNFGDATMQARKFLGGGFTKLADAHGVEPAVEWL